ncbi:MAG: glycoside hydrolase family 16 protein, partial [Chitinophagia bacterium]|nr:glycoside hydrolase family 16 protein [Chitinophagia bacterium]
MQLLAYAPNTEANAAKICGPDSTQTTAQFETTPIWADEFDKPGAPDPTKWSYETGGNGFGNNELQYYTPGQNVKVENGVLKITARMEPYENRQFTSGKMITKGKGDWKYGRFEARIKLPSGKGTWPAFWMLSTDAIYGGWPKSGEIDIMEHVGYDL